MNATNEIKRREFLNRTSGALGLLALGTRLGGSEPERKPTVPDDATLEKLLHGMEADGPLYLSVPVKDGQFLRLFVEATGSQRILEVGTSHGYTATWLSLGLEETGGHLTTIEILPERVEMAKKHVGQAGLAHRVTFKEGDAHAIVPTLDGPFDLVFLNADKEGQVDYFEKLFPQKLSPGGNIVSYCAIKQREKMKAYLDLVGQHPQFHTVILSCTMDDGFAVSHRRRK